MNDDPLFGQFDDINPDKVELEMASKPVADMFKAFRSHGLTIQEAAVLTYQLTIGVFNHGEDLGDSKS